MAEVTVRGAGIFGLSIAWACLLRGARVQVVDPGGVGAGASGGIVGALAPHTPENWNDKKAFQLDSLLMAEGFWSQVEGASGTVSGYARTGRIQPIADARALERAQVRTLGAAELWRDTAHWSVAPSGVDWAPTSASGYLITDTLSARIYPKLACHALAAAIHAQGGTIVAEAADQGAVVWACGAPGLETLSAALNKDIGRGEKGQAALLRLAEPPPENAPQIFADAVHMVAHHDGTVAIGSTSERVFDDGHTTDVLLDRLIERAQVAVPYLRGAKVIQRWAGVRPRSTTRAPVLGAHPLRTGHFIANGGFKIGFGIAPKVADVIAKLVLEGIDEIPYDFKVEASL
jgi:glycine oxidase